MGTFTVDGRQFDLPAIETLTFRDYGLIKKWTGLRAGELEEAFGAGDSDPVMALMVIGMRRAGHTIEPDFLLDMDPGLLEVQVDAPEVPADPPAEGGETAQPTPTSETVTPETSGIPDSSSSTDSAPGTSESYALASSTS